MAGRAGNATKDLLLGDDPQKDAQRAELILSLISDAAEGREIANVVSDVIQVMIAGGVGQHQVRKLAYDLCRAVPLLDADYSLLLDGIRNDVTSGVPESQVMALSFLPHLPPQLLVDCLEKGDVGTLVVQNTRSIAPSVRASATTCLGALLLQPDVQAALAASPVLLASSDDWWDAVTDGLADPMADVILAALAATNKLFEAAATAAHGATAMRTSARRTALRVCLVTGPLVDTWRMLPSHSQVAVASLMGHVASAVVQLDPSQAAQAGDGIDTGGLGGSLSAALGGAISYLAGALQSLNPAVKLEAARVLLRMSSTSRSLPPLSLVRVAASVPPSVAASAIAALLELKERTLVEAALAEVISLVAGHLDVLPVATRVDVLRRLWPMIALLQSPTDRMTAFAASWRTAVDMHLQASEAASKGLESPVEMLLPTLLSDPFISDIINQKPPPVVAPGLAPGTPSSLAQASPSRGGDAASAGGGAGRPSVDLLSSPVSAGPTGASSVSPVAAGPTGASTASSALTAAGAPGVSAAAALGVGTPRTSDSGLPPTPSSSARASLQSAQQKLASSAKTVGDTLSGAALSAADLVRTAAVNLPRLFEAPVAAARGLLPASLKQELVCSLLGVLAQHPSAGLALQLQAGEPVELPPLADDAAGEQAKQQSDQPQAGNGANGTPLAAAATPPSTPPPAQLPPPVLPVTLHPNAAAYGELQERAVLWLDAAVAALQATGSCLQWEPLLSPPLPGQPPAPKLPATESVNLTTVPVDIWLQLLQGTCAASRSVLRAHGHTGLKTIYRAHGGRMLPQLTEFDANGTLARTLEAASIALQTLIQRALTGWRVLSLAARPRVLWVAAHYLELPVMLEDTWSCLLACVEDTLLRVWRLESDAHARLLATSAREGLLFKKAALAQLGAPQQASKANQAQFDAAAASALVELPEYRADALQVALCVLQYLAWVVQANAQRRGVDGKAGPAEVALAKRLLDVVKAAGAAEATGVDLKEWCRRMSRSLAAAAEQEAANAPAAHAHAGAGGPAFVVAAPTAPGRGALPGGYNAVAGFSALGFGGGDSSSDDDSASEQSAASNSSAADAAVGGPHSSDDDTDSSASSRRSSGDGTTAAPGDDGALKSLQAAARIKRKAAREREREVVARSNLLVGNPEASSGAWGYPFSGPRARTLFISRRSRRHRLMRWHLAAALAEGAADNAAAASGGDQGGLTLAAAGSTDDTGPVFSASSGFRLDKRAFWDSLLPGSGATSGWEELTGPNDPLVLSACYSVAKAGGAEVLVTLRAYNRLALDVEDVEVAVRLAGPVRTERRGGEVSWMLPRLLPTEAATHQFKLLPTGYGRLELHARIVLPVGGEAAVPALRCRPLAVSMARMLRVPRGLVPGPHGFLEAWSSLPVSAELPVVAAWPGVDGLLLALSAFARQPLRCAWQRALPAVCGAQAAYLTAPAAAPNESLALVLTLQLMPPPGWGAPAADNARQARDSDAASGGSGGGASDGAAAAKAPGTGKGSGQLAVEAAQRLCGEMTAVGQLQLRSSSHEVVLAVRDSAAAFVQDLAQGTLALGLMPPTMAASDKPLLHPSVACLARCFEAAPPAVPLPPQVAEPAVPPAPKFARRLKEKRDEEDSDAEDEVLPPTEEEKEQQRRELEEHEEECAKVREKHRQALSTRAAEVLHCAAIAEWKRLAGGGAV
ncbi:hypothetical protein Rsub_02821 [Raphidocelis subcapitata]|uniref:Uncharacterized protein n=1 Tax=Raphidocelis subcapitata TaxID=307507 RepID=A0A2V0NX21_9CHLO|nr:hypothetical protein Rsub_02821 [Raphidocelis subcapitata]|eukprot:GBF90113.1 hypothetical protein Rsub_02821 [Raphidocelis subcapitata]